MTNRETNEGGLKAVVWTDVIQTIIMLGAVLVIVVKGTINVGGLGVVWERNYQSGRIELPTMTWDPTERVSMLSMFVGTTLFFTQVTAGNQGMIQRYLSLPSLKDAKKCLILFVIGVTILKGVTFYNGLLLYANYYDCDPLTTKLAKAKDQLMPLLTMEILGEFPGTAGLFVAAVFSAALSTLSTGLNALSAVVLEDYVKPRMTSPPTEFQTALIMRGSVVGFGILCVGLVFVVEHMGTVLQLTMTLGSITNGPLLGLFFMGLLLPWINGKSALFGSCISFGLMSWICIKAQLDIASGELKYPVKPVSTAGCSYTFNVTTPLANESAMLEEGPKPSAHYIFHMSFMFYVLVGSALSIIFASLASLMNGHNDSSKMNLELFAPFVRKFIKTEKGYVGVQPDELTGRRISYPVKDNSTE